MTVDETKAERNPKVSVCIITYNHAEFIGQTIEGALAQETSFPFEIIIGDDGSTDGTREILLRYQEKYPDRIRLHLHEHWDDGIPGRLNNITNIESARGAYLAFCDGDDYWLSADKLQKQADFLDNHDEYALSFHDARYLVDGHLKHSFSDRFHLLNKQAVNKQNLALRKFDVPASSVFVRKKALEPIPDWFWKIYSADTALQLLACRQGKIHFHGDIQSAYRLHSQSFSNQQGSAFDTLAQRKHDYEILNNQFASLDIRLIDYRAFHHFRSFVDSLKQKQYMKALWRLAKSLYHDSAIYAQLKSLIRFRLSTKLSR